MFPRRSTKSEHPLVVFSYVACLCATVLLLVGCNGGEPTQMSSGDDSSAGYESSDSERAYSNSTASMPKVKKSEALADSGGAAPMESEARIDFDDSTDADFNTEAYDHIAENEFLNVLKNPQSTFSIDVDTASYSNVRRMLNDGMMPPAGAVRIEEFVNYFSYDYDQPVDSHPFAVALDIASCPWNSNNQLVRIALKGKEIEISERPSSNLVFLLDVSGSMNSQNKLPLVKSAMSMLLDQLDERDRIAIAVYAGASGMVLESTPAHKKATILRAIDNLAAGGSTNGGEGIELAYRIAQQNFIEGGINRVILCTDGDFNVGTTSQSELVKMIENKAKSNIFLSVCGFGTGNYKDSTMEKLADKGNGNYAYIDSLLEARKALVRQMNGTLITIAKDVKIQIDFNPNRVKEYRLIGYENRKLANEDFEDDEKDAGEIGAGHTITALYEIVPNDSESTETSTSTEFVETVTREDAGTDSILKVALRYKQPEGDTSQLFEVRLEHPTDEQFAEMSSDFEFVSAVAAFAMLLRDSEHAGEASFDWVVETAERNLGNDRDGFRAEFIGLAKKARMMHQ